MRHGILYALAALLFLAGVLQQSAVAEVDIQSYLTSGWLEMWRGGVCFSSDWLTDLDNGDYAAAASVFKVDGDPAESVELLRSMRGELGSFKSRSYNRTSVVEVAGDWSEMKVRVVYETEFAAKTVLETVDVLLWHKDPVILRYDIEE